MAESIAEAAKEWTPEQARRIYRVKVGGGEQYVLAKSPGKAALSVVTVERVTDREISTALLEAAVVPKGDAESEVAQ